MTHLNMLAAGLCLLITCGAWAGGTPQGTAFTYHGVFKVGGTPANGTHHLRFQLFDAVTGGAQVGADFDLPSLAIIDGLFKADLDFGPVAFDGSVRWLAVQVVTNGGATVTTLVPRQAVNAAPYALYALSADGPSLTNLNASNLVSGTVPGAQLAGTYANALSLTHASNSFAGTFTGSGAGITSLNATNIASGNLATARLPTGGPWTLSSNLDLDSNTLVIDQANNRVGIGTASPQATLHLVTGGEGLRLQGPANSIDNTAWMQFNNAAGTRIGYLGDGSTTDNSMYLTADVGDIHLYTAIGAALTAKPNGNVGIGTTTPAAPLHVRTTGPFMVLQDNAGANQQAGYVAYWNSLGQETAWVGFGTPSNTDFTIRSTRADIHIDPNGSVIIDGLLRSPNAIIGPIATNIGITLVVNGVAAKPGGGSWTTLSDRRLKKGIEPLHNSLEQLLALRGVSYEYIDPGSINELHGTRIGMIAQDVEQVFPDWVEELDNGYKALTFRGFEALTVEALRDLREEKDAENKALRERIAALEEIVRQLSESR